jgi:hypothetical protein
MNSNQQNIERIKLKTKKNNETNSQSTQVNLPKPQPESWTRLHLINFLIIFYLII